MEKANSQVALAIFSALGAQRMALGNIQKTQEFKIELSTSLDASDIKEKNVGSKVEARITGKDVNTETSVYKIASIIVCTKQEGNEFKHNTVTRNGATILSSRELLRESEFMNLPAFIKGLDKNAEFKDADITTLQYKVIGHIGMNNRNSTEATAARRLKYQPEYYSGFTIFDTTTSAITDFNAPGAVQKYMDANKLLLASDLRLGAEEDKHARVTTIIVEVIQPA